MTRAHMQMLTSVVQALVLDALTCIVIHYIWGNTKSKVNHYEFFAGPDHYMPFPDVNISSVRESTEALQNQHPSNFTTSNTTKVILHNATFTVNDTLFTFGHAWGEMTNEKESFWFKSLPKEMLPLLFILPLNYYWMLWLERILPGRKRVDAAGSSSSVTSPAEKMGVEDDVAEEEVIKRWIAQGRVQRSSLSWLNTFLKWTMDQILGNAWRCLVGFAIEYTLIHRASLESMREEIWIVSCVFSVTSCALQALIAVYTFNLLSATSLGTLLSFILVPAYKRVVFISLSSLVWTILFQAVLNLMLPWLLAQRWMQEVISSANAEVRRNVLKDAAMNRTVEVTWETRPEL